MINRSIPPQGQDIRLAPLPNFEQQSLSNGIPVYFLPFGSVEVVEIQMVFRAGLAYEPQTGAAHFTAKMLQEGTKQYNSLELSQQLDSFGSWMRTEIGTEYVSIALASLTKHLPKTLPLLHQAVIMPTFPEEEFRKMKLRTLQKYTVQEQQTRPMARRHFGHELFGPKHPYGKHLGRPELENLEWNDLKSYFAQYLRPSNCFIQVVGKFDEAEIMAQLETLWGSLSTPPILPPLISSAENASPKEEIGRHTIEIEGMQSTIRLGHLGINRFHPDHDKMLVVNTILGGYFGSRLMQNIREEKGYTYGISSGWIGLRHAGYFVVQADVGNEYIEATIKEVKKEIKRMQQEKVSEDELSLVKNYLMGQNINQRETPFQMADLIRFSVVSGVSFEELDNKLRIIQQITTDEVLDLAQKHLKTENMLEIVAGGGEA